MQGRSWMAALTLAAGFSAALAIAGDGEKTVPPPAAKPSAPASQSERSAPATKIKPTTTLNTKDSAAKPHTIKLDLKIAGLTTKGCDVEIKAAHPGCKFRTRNEHVGGNGLLLVELDDVEIVNADRDCTFAITIREAGLAERTWRRGLRINATPALAQTLPCYLSSPSKLARAGEQSSKTKR